MDLIFATGNELKYKLAKSALATYDIKLSKLDCQVDEIQSTDPTKILLDKLTNSFEKIKRPLFVTDDNWQIPALNGFPGPYMKDISTWLDAKSLQSLFKSLQDKTIILTQHVGFTDGSLQKTFTSQIKGIILDHPVGQKGTDFQKLVSMLPDKKTSISQELVSEHYHKKESTKVFEDLYKWLTLEYYQ